MLNAEIKTASTAYVPFYDSQFLEGKTSFIVTILKDNEIFFGLTTPPVLSEFGNGLYSLSFVFTESGYYAICIEGAIYAYFKVVTRGSNDILQDLDDSSLGSYLYNKETGLLTLLRKSGSELAKYTVVDNNQQTSRELIS